MLVEANSVVGWRSSALPQDTQYWAILSQYEIYSARIAQALIWAPVVLFVYAAVAGVSLLSIAGITAGTITLVIVGWWLLSSFAKAELTGSLYKDYIQAVHNHIIGTIEVVAILLAVVPLLAMFVINSGV